MPSLSQAMAPAMCGPGVGGGGSGLFIIFIAGLGMLTGWVLAILRIFTCDDVPGNCVT